MSEKSVRKSIIFRFFQLFAFFVLIALAVGVVLFPELARKQLDSFIAGIQTPVAIAAGNQAGAINIATGNLVPLGQTLSYCGMDFRLEAETVGEVANIIIFQLTEDSTRAGETHMRDRLNSLVPRYISGNQVFMAYNPADLWCNAQTGAYFELAAWENNPEQLPFIQERNETLSSWTQKGYIYFIGVPVQ